MLKRFRIYVKEKILRNNNKRDELMLQPLTFISFISSKLILIIKETIKRLMYPMDIKNR